MGSMLSDFEAKSAQPKENAYHLTVSRGLYLNVLPSGKKFFRCRMMNAEGKRVWHTIGDYPDISLKEARDRHFEIRRRESAGLPTEDAPKEESRFVRAIEEYQRRRASMRLSEKTRFTENSLIRRFVIPAIGEMDMTQIRPKDIIAMVEPIIQDVSPITANDVKSVTSRIFKLAAAIGMTTYDPCSVLRGYIKQPPKEHHPTIRDPREIGAMLRTVNDIEPRQTRLAILMLICTLTRTGEVRRAEWDEIDIKEKLWRIAPEKMKMKRPHLVPLSRQMIRLLKTMREITGGGRYIFPKTQPRGSDEPLGIETIRRKLINVGISNDVIVPHGFRAMGSTLLNENGFNADWIERQLAHIEHNRVRAAYNYADYLGDRRRMLQWYSDKLDELRGAPMNLD